MNIKLVGVDAMIGKMMLLRTGMKKETGSALYAEAQIELTEAKRRTPVDTGTLRASGFVSKPEEGPGDKVSVTIGFGGAAESYAIIVHEDLEAFHKIGQAKFLESTLIESAAYMKDRIAKRISLRRAGKG